jgi:hypothetical protein
MGSALLLNGLESGDSLLIYYGDSVSNGNEAYLGEGSDGKARYINAQWRIERSMLVSGGAKGAARFHTVPSLVYSYRQHVKTVPKEPNALKDKKATQHSVSFQLGADSTLTFGYLGGMGFVFEREDRLFGNQVSRTLSSGNADSLIENNQDHDGTGAEMSHQLAVPLGEAVVLSYDYSIARMSITYPNWYLDPADPGDTVRFGGDNDQLNQEHTVGVELPGSDTWGLRLRGRFAKQILNYIRSSRSSRNNTDREYLVEALLDLMPRDFLSIGEHLSAETYATEYMFPEAYLLDPPPYRRKFASVLCAEWTVSPLVTVGGEWTQLFYDQGQWCSPEYFPPDSAVRTGYGQQYKTTEYKVSLFARLTLDWLQGECGGQVGDIYPQVFRSGRFVLDRNQEEGYVLEPYMELLAAFVERYEIMARVKPRLELMKNNGGGWGVHDYWDLGLVARARF